MPPFSTADGATFYSIHLGLNCEHAQVFTKKLLHELHLSYTHTEYGTCFYRETRWSLLRPKLRLSETIITVKLFWKFSCFALILFLSSVRGRVDDLSFFNCSKSILFLLLDFHCYFFISSNRILYYVYYYCILIS